MTWDKAARAELIAASLALTAVTEAHEPAEPAPAVPEPVAAAAELCPELEMGAGSLSGTFEAQPTRVTMKAKERRTEIR